jgi:hypothetical protein
MTPSPMPTAAAVAAAAITAKISAMDAVTSVRRLECFQLFSPIFAYFTCVAILMHVFNILQKHVLHAS